MPCDTRKSPYLVEKHGDGKKNVSKPGISIIKCLSMRAKTLFGNQNFVSGDPFTGASCHKATWKKFSLEHCYGKFLIIISWLGCLYTFVS